MAAAGLPTADGPAQALSGAPLVLSLVTADEAALKAAQDYAPLLSPGALWCDGNSVAPETKRAAARAVEAAGGRYVDLAGACPGSSRAAAVPLLLAGAAADDAAERLNVLGFTNLRVVGDEVGRASAIKMIRSVMVKGIEALTDEMMAAAEAAGVTDEVLLLAERQRKGAALGATRRLQSGEDAHPRPAPCGGNGREREDAAGAGGSPGDDARHRLSPETSSPTEPGFARCERRWRTLNI